MKRCQTGANVGGANGKSFRGGTENAENRKLNSKHSRKEHRTENYKKLNAI